MQTQDNKEISDQQSLMNKLMVVGKESKVNQQIAIYIEKNYTSIVFLTANQLSNKIGVSQGSVSRFCIKMGYDGYNDFLRYLQKIVSNEMTTPKRASFLKNDRMDVSSILNQEIYNIEELEHIIQTISYKRAVNLLSKVDNVILMSNRMSETLLPYMNYTLSRLRANVRYVHDATPSWYNLDFQDPNDAVIFTTVLPRYSKSLMTKLRTLHERGFKIIALTDSQISPVSELTNDLLITPITTSSIFDVYSTPILLISLLMRDVAKNLPHIDKRLNEIENQNNDSGAFLE